jgi:hypothetical protein
MMAFFHELKEEDRAFAEIVCKEQFPLIVNAHSNVFSKKNLKIILGIGLDAEVENKKTVAIHTIAPVVAIGEKIPTPPIIVHGKTPLPAYTVDSTAYCTYCHFKPGWIPPKYACTHNFDTDSTQRHARTCKGEINCPFLKMKTCEFCENNGVIFPGHLTKDCPHSKATPTPSRSPAKKPNNKKKMVIDADGWCCTVCD